MARPPDRRSTQDDDSWSLDRRSTKEDDAWSLDRRLTQRDDASDSDEATAYQEDSLDEAENIDSEFEEFLKTFEPDPGDNDHETPLHRLARRPSAFNDSKGPTLLCLLLRNGTECLHNGGDLLKPKFPLHVAIETSNEAFLETFLDLFDDPLIDGDDLSQALEMVNNNYEKCNCLHSAITRRLSCTARMVTKCSERALTMVDSGKNTPLHLAMNAGKMTRVTPQMVDINQERTFPNSSKARTAKNHQDSMAEPTSSTGADQRDARTSVPRGRPFHPADVLEEMKNFRPEGHKNAFMAKLLTATNNLGMSPYQVRLQVFKQPSEEERRLQKALKNVKKASDEEKTLQKKLDNVLKQNEEEKNFQKELKQLIFDCLTEISDIRKALYGTLGNEKELCLDMSDFNQSSHDFTRFITQLTQHSKPDNLHFEETLYYIYLPDLNTFKKTCPHDGVRSLFVWLNEQKGVKTIKILNIPDNTISPMSDELVGSAIIDRFNIEKFDWRKLDINLDTLTRSYHAARFTDITLYSSGNWSVLYHWASEDGLAKLGALKKVTIEIMELNPSMHDTKAHKRHNILTEKYKEALDRQFEEMKAKKKEKGIDFEYEVKVNGKWDFPVLQCPDGDDPFVPNLKIFDQLDKCHTSLRDLKKSTESQIKKYAKRFETLTKEPSPGTPDLRIKVAIIDNGADKIRSSVKTNIAKGVSFVTADSESKARILPWWMVADPHGTQMASLIKKANPFCQLYIARVGKGRKDILPENAAKAVEWAIEQKVDVISMSWITKKDTKELREAIEKAVKESDDPNVRPILVFCSTADEGVYSGNVYPACHDGTVRVAATDKYGHLRPASEAGVNVLVPGEDIAADGPSYMGQYTVGTVSGSSVATALASGIASLALLLLQTFNAVDNAVMKEFFTKHGIMRVFSKMDSEINGIQLFDLFPDNSKQLPDAWNISNFPKIENKPRPN